GDVVDGRAVLDGLAERREDGVRRGAETRGAQGAERCGEDAARTRDGVDGVLAVLVGGTDLDVIAGAVAGSRASSSAGTGPGVVVGAGADLGVGASTRAGTSAGSGARPGGAFVGVVIVAVDDQVGEAARTLVDGVAALQGIELLG